MSKKTVGISRSFIRWFVCCLIGIIAVAYAAYFWLLAVLTGRLIMGGRRKRHAR